MLEADDVVGGISQTEQCTGWRFDIGGHRFFSKSERSTRSGARSSATDDFLSRPRLSRIYYDGKFYRLPAQAVQRPAQPRARSRRAAAWLSYLWARVRPPADQSSFEDWVAAASAAGSTGSSSRPTPRRSGACPATEIPADWAAQRIKSLSLCERRASARCSRRARREVITLIDSSSTRGSARGRCGNAPGTWSVQAGQRGRSMDRRWSRGSARRPGDRVRGRAPTGSDSDYRLGAVVSSMPIRELVRAMDPPAPAEVLEPPPRRCVPRLPHRRPDRAAGAELPGQLDLRPRAGRPGRPGPELQELVARPGPRRARPAWAWSTSASRGTTSGRMPDAELIELGRARSDQLGLVAPDVVERLRRPDAQGLPGLRRRLPEHLEVIRALAREHCPTWSWPGATGCTSTTTRTTR